MNCLRCGRTVPDQVLFCPECTRKDRPARRAAPPPEAAFASPEQEQAEAVQRLRGKLHRLRRWVAVLVLFALACLGLLGYGIVSTASQRSQLMVQVSKANSLQAAMDDLQDDLDAANALTDSMKAIIARYQEMTGLSPDELE